MRKRDSMMVNYIESDRNMFLSKMMLATKDEEPPLVDENGDTMTIDVELRELFTDDYRRLQALTATIVRQLKDEILVTPKVRLVPKGTLAVSDEKKAVRVRDLRKLF